MVPQTNHRHPCVFLAVNIYCLLVYGNAASSLHVEHGFERRADFDGATALTRTILLNVSSPSLIAATSTCSILSQAVALLYHRELKQCYCLDERILPWSLRISSDLSWMYYEKPGYTGCPRAMEPYNGHLYCFHLRTASLGHAKSNCSSIGGYLLEIESSAENRWLSQRMYFFYYNQGAWGSWWTGGNDVAKEGKYKWGTSGRDIVYTNWVSPEPNGGTNENCITVDYRGDWATVRCGRYFLYVCEV